MNRKTGGSDVGFVVLVFGAILFVFGMPLIGLYFIAKDTPDDRAIGTVLIVIGVIVWLYAAIKMAVGA